ncbi:MAG TPA: hypothetical protein ENN78_00760, partial [Candidatus Omnitrophica bacterium]|nr:hypothetical protein [Candidatus Omnitrophota bacterium]
LFGVEPEEIKKDCIISPFWSASALLGSKVHANKGLLYETAEAEDFTLMKTGMGPVFCGDCVLYLKDTPCKNIYLFGSCGAVKNLDLGDMVLIKGAYDLEGFSRMLKNRDRYHFLHRPEVTQKMVSVPIFYNADKSLTNSLLEYAEDIKPATCATVGSLKLEIKYKDAFVRNGIDCVDLEASAVFSAANSVKRKALGLFYVSDVIEKYPFYKPYSSQEKNLLNESRKRAFRLLCQFINRNISESKILKH